MPIIAGKIGGCGPGDDQRIMEEHIEELEKLICHPMRIAVLYDCQGQEIKQLTPDRK